jgi:hypothetical protein
MKQYLKSLTVLPLAVMFFATAFAVAPAASAKDLHIAGAIDTLENDVVTPPTMLVQLEGTGCASHLGHYVLSVKETVFLPTLASTGTIEIDVGCGDKLFGTTVGQGTPTDDPDVVSIVEVNTITGGTGRFRGATGTITVYRLLDVPATTSSGAIVGTIKLPDQRGCGGKH